MHASSFSPHLFLEEDSAHWPCSQQEDLAHEPYGAGLPARTAPRRPLDVASVLAQPRVQPAHCSYQAKELLAISPVRGFAWECAHQGEVMAVVSLEYWVGGLHGESRPEFENMLVLHEVRTHILQHLSGKLLLPDTAQRQQRGRNLFIVIDPVLEECTLIQQSDDRRLFGDANGPGCLCALETVHGAVNALRRGSGLAGRAMYTPTARALLSCICKTIKSLDHINARRVRLIAMCILTYTRADTVSKVRIPERGRGGLCLVLHVDKTYNNAVLLWS